MTKKIEKTLWVSSVEPELLAGQKYIPTALCYLGNDELLFGSPALEKLNGESIVNREFKVALGDVVPGGSSVNRREFAVETGDPKNAYSLTKDYLDNLLSHVEHRFPRSEETKFKHPAKIIVAEPLSFQVEGYSQKWIYNYRDNIRRILDRYEEVEFLPEPFAVFQYYRYGCRIPILQDAAKHVAFILDFGGGTFDACVIESTNKGDISLSGKASKPLAADSDPIGGFYINREIATYLIKRDLENGKRKEADKFISQYKRVLSGELRFESLGTRNQCFISNFMKLEAESEQYKINLASKIRSWSLDGDAYEKIVIKIPEDPFSDSPWINSEFYAHQMRKVFVQEVWRKHLKKTVFNVLSRSREALDDRSISVTLVSGGSSNLQWLQELLVEEFSEELDSAEPVPISHSFQEVVANGLAIECARRFYDPNSEFVAVTYNPIKLFLDPDGAGIEGEKRYKSVSENIDMTSAKQADLVPSAQSLKNFFNVPLQWKIKLSKPPKNYLDYFFSRPDSEDEFDYYNVEETRVVTRDNRHFDSSTTVEIVIREDGTVTPKFIYKAENTQFGAEENSVVGRPFHIDMTTDGHEVKSGSHFLGLDFGTSNSSLCVLDSEKIKITSQRQSSSTWKGLSTAVSHLPFPVAISVRKFLGTTQERELPSSAREAFESCLAFMAYTAAAEASLNSSIERIMRNFQHRSMGPLKALLESSLKELGSNPEFSVGFLDLFSPKNKNRFTQAMKDFTDHKHEKLDFKDVDWQGHVELLVKILSASLEGQMFGYSTECEIEPFSSENYRGLFMVAHDNAPFINSFDYWSSESIGKNLALLYHRRLNKALSLSPLIFWFDRTHTSVPHGCFWLDKRDDDEIVVKPCDERNCIVASGIHGSLTMAFDGLYSQGKTLLGAVPMEARLKG
ncbi:Hsp70 family protein [Marinobacter sp. F3R08]|uniref:Hsp70 family protein n=1 Tax=Marinobacter sp. F3R08 TaxID=2841559 RepID=UPI001C0A4DA1|nr:hypothetical protein [Marinobacter sp. F3R08]MBU2953667.1 hypothetical protein [Marinobacter sp. F3R08]